MKMNDGHICCWRWKWLWYELDNISILTSYVIFTWWVSTINWILTAICFININLISITRLAILATFQSLTVCMGIIRRTEEKCPWRRETEKENKYFNCVRIIQKMCKFIFYCIIDLPLGHVSQLYLHFPL